MEYERSEEVEAIARDLIPRFHRHLLDGNAIGRASCRERV